MKKIKYIFLFFFFSISHLFAGIEDDMIPDDPDTIIINYDKEWEPLLVSIFEYIKESLFWILSLIAIWAFIYVWIKLIMAKWSPEEFKKALMHFIYIVIGLAIIAISWVVVRLVSGLNF